ncbi:multidrug effflux MFS transporter [Zoogloea sp.]|uniref:multidrug effflux MFS transporter n=1 Tax=Zoogloea sp. TaxID=49181 RepID=UPI0035B2F037
MTPGGRLQGRGLLALLGALVAFGPLAIDLYLPALPAIAQGLGADIARVQLSVTVFLAGFCIGMLGYGPVSDHFGRRPVLLGGIALFVGASAVCALAPGVEVLIAARFFQALGGGAASVLARAVARDVYAPTEAIRMLSLMAMVTAVAPLVAPLLGGLALAWQGWRACFGLLVGWGLLCLLVCARHLPETLPPARRGQTRLGAAFGVYGQMLRDPAGLGLVLAGGMSFAAMFAYITAGPFYFIELQGFTPFGYSLLFAANALGIFAANFANSRLVRRVGAPAMIRAGCLLGLAGALPLPFIGAHPAWVMAALFVVVGVTGLLGANCVGLLMQGYGHNAGAAAALFGAGQFGFGMLASWATGHFHEGSGQPMAWVILVASSLSALGFALHRSCHDPRFQPPSAA